MKLHLSHLLMAVCVGCFVAVYPFTSANAFRDNPTSAGDNSTSSAPEKVKNATNDLQDSDISRFTDAISQIKDYYVAPISDKKLLEDAIRGMLEGLDPHSEYLDADAYKTLLVATDGEFGGLGIEVTGEYGVLKVVSPIDDTPAAKAGIKAGDYIVAINGKLVNEMTLNEAVNGMRGKKGTPVTLSVIRKAQKTPLSFKLIRDQIHITSVKSRMLEPGFGYIRISEFDKPTTGLVNAAILALKKQAGGHLDGVILDLRNNPGGLLETAVEVSDLFLDNKKIGNLYNQQIVYTEGRLQGKQYSGKISDKPDGDILGNAPLVILINEGSASASEIVTGALQDYHRAIVVGTPSFGKGSVQTVLPLDDTHAIKLTTALYHTPSGRLIQNKGIMPDVTVDSMKIADDPTVDTSILAPIREFELKGHLPGDTTKSASADDTTSDAKLSAQLARDDFQLYEALGILKTMHTLSGNTSISVTPTTAITKK